MRSRMIKLLSVVLGLLVLCGLAVGCKEEKKETETTQEYVLCGFESKKELLSIVYNFFGKIELESGDTYVKEGENCAKITTEIPVRESKGTDLSMVFITGTQYIEKTDFSDTVAFEVDILNATESPIAFSMTLNVNTILGYFTLEKGENHLVVPVNRECYDLRSVNTLEFWFEGKDAEVVDPYELYIDNFVAIVAEDKVNQKTYSFAGDTPFRFENEYEIAGVMDYMGSVESVFTKPRYSLNRDLQYILTGTGSMRIDFFSKSTGGMDSLGFRSVVGTSDLSWNEYDYASTYLSFDMYNPTDKNITIELAIFTKTNESIGKSIALPANSWTDPLEARMLLKDILDMTVGDKLDIMTIVFNVIGLDGTGDSLYLDNISFKTADQF